MLILYEPLETDGLVNLQLWYIYITHRDIVSWI